MHKDHGGWRHLNASLEEKVEILSENPYRFYIYPNVWTFRGEAHAKTSSLLHTQTQEK